jgi:very-short-patch-repair endonuclease
MEHARQRPDQSLGVATFSSAQQEAVREQLEVMRRRDPSCESFFNAHPSEPFFVKNLESVQGDQRDVMFISVGYGRADDGRVSMNFGPLNSEGGERRLNVLTTRAKYRCEVFTNLRAEDIDLNRTSARGVEVLKQYLKFAETGEMQMARPTGEEPDSPFEEAVADALRNEGYRVEHQIGQSGFSIDLAVVDPERPGHYVLGIECDGATYHSSRMARDRDRARQAVLESQGWNIHRIWSTDWFRNPDDQLARAVAAIEKARRDAEAGRDDPGASRKPIDEAVTTGEENAGDSDVSTADVDEANAVLTDGQDHASGEKQQEHASVDHIEDEGDAETVRSDSKQEQVSDGEQVDGGENGRHEMTTIDRAEPDDDDGSLSVPYTIAELHISTEKALHEVSRTAVAEWVSDVVEVEGPVATEVVARRILDAAGVTRLGSRIREAIEKAVEFAMLQGWIRVDDHALRRPDESAVPVRDRSDTDKYTRDIENIPDCEIEQAVQRLLEGAYGARRENVIRQVSRLLGFSKMGSTIHDGIDSVIADMVGRGDLSADGDTLQLVAADSEANE